MPIEDLGNIHVGISREQLDNRVELLRRDLISGTGLVGGVTLILLLSAYSVIWWMLRRGQEL